MATLGFSILLGSHVFTQLLVHLLDAFTNSLNAFTQLGFGEIPFQGLAKYMAVLEGFVGKRPPNHILQVDVASLSHR